MNFEKAKIIEYDNIEYVTVSIIKEKDKEYAFANKLNDNEEPTDEYRIFTIFEGDLTIVEDNNLINKLLSIFQKEIEKDLKGILNDK